ncbi:MAG: hypothetical protein IID35_01905 [Planctomycetes bacterium]|nr:hypothetical protein [Planctomycetota bacterium]
MSQTSVTPSDPAPGNTDAASHVDASAGNDASDERRWPVLFALIGAWARPATTAERTSHVSMLRAWAFHLVVVILAAALIALLVVVTDNDTLNFNSVSRELYRVCVEVGDHFQRQSVETVLTVLGVALLIETCYCAVAFLLMPWGARDEPIRQSYKHALRRAWIGTPAIVMGILVTGSVAVTVERMDRSWRRAHPPPTTRLPYPDYPRIASTAPGYKKTMDDYFAAVKEHKVKSAPYRKARAEWRASKPWYIRQPEMLAVGTGFIVGPWALWCLFCAVGARRRAPPLDRPQQCTHCGYNLHTIPMESRCPECGESVVSSLGPDAQPGTPWQRRDGDSLMAWRTTLALAIRTPKQLGSQLRLIDPGTDHRRFFVVHLPMVYATATGALVCAFVLLGGGTQSGVLLPLVIVSTVFASLCVVGTVAVTMLGALLAGLIQSSRYRRNLLPGAMQMASYLGGYLVMWAAMGAVLGVGISLGTRTEFFELLETLTGMRSDTLVAATFLIPNIVCGIVYLVLLGRGTEATRYANR